MKKEYKVPMLNMINAKAEDQILAGSQGYEWADSKKNGRGFVDDEEEVPAAEPKKFWDDED